MRTPATFPWEAPRATHTGIYVFSNVRQVTAPQFKEKRVRAINYQQVPLAAHSVRKTTNQGPAGRG